MQAFYFGALGILENFAGRKIYCIMAVPFASVLQTLAIAFPGAAGGAEFGKLQRRHTFGPFAVFVSQNVSTGVVSLCVS